MSIEARKYQLIEQMMKLDEAELRKLENFLQAEPKLSTSLDKSIQQAEEGETMPHSEVKKLYQKWL